MADKLPEGFKYTEVKDKIKETNLCHELGGAREILDIHVGMKFQLFYNENNINNVNYCEVRAIVDETQLVLLCQKNEESDPYYSLSTIWEIQYKAKHNSIKLIIES